jgi:tRNA threonylcarbamoyl adenosine modification protein (Sua5/YciO/YrdC/YwlC family)
MSLLKLYGTNTNRKDLDRVVEILRGGGIIIYPTDTVYAIGCDALNVRAVERICRIKGINPLKSNLSIICHDLSNISEYARVSNQVFKLMKRHLPGPFTFILNVTSNLPKIYKNRKEVGIRVPANGIALAIVEALGNPLLSTSVRNKDDFMEYSTDPELIDEEYGAIVDLVVDGGFGGLEPSTVVDCTGDEIEIIRQGKGELTDIQ